MSRIPSTDTGPGRSFSTATTSSGPVLPAHGKLDLIPFQVSRATQSIPNHPASELQTQSPATRGYITATLPAEIVLDLPHGAAFDLHELQILSHESKVASRIDVAVLQHGGDQYKSLGFLEFDDNSRSGYMARELQTAQLAYPNVTAVRLTLHKAYHNEINPAGQVGIIGLNLLGVKSSSQPSPSSQQPQPQLQQQPQEPSRSPQSQPSTPGSSMAESVRVLIQRVEELRKLKDAAVAREAYDEAAHLKQAELEARALAEIATNLERAKLEAVEKEDYEEAKRIKAKLNDILNNNGKTEKLASPVRQPPTRPTPKQASSPERPIRSPPRSGSPPVPAHGKSMNGESVSSTVGNKEYEEGPPPGFWNGIEDAEVLPVADPLEANLRSSVDVQLLMNSFGLYTVRCLYSADIRLRAAILARIDKQLREDRNLALSPDKLDAALVAVALGLSENAPHVFLAASKVLEWMLDGRLTPEKVRSSGQCEHAIIPHLLDALANSSAHVQQAATKLFLRLAGIFGTDFALRAVLNRSAQSKRSTLWRPLHARLLILEQLIQAQDFDPTIWTIEILEWNKSSATFAHANEAVRDAALTVTRMLYRATPDKLDIEDFLRGALRPSQLDKYLNDLVRLDGPSDVLAKRLSTSPNPRSKTSPSRGNLQLPAALSSPDLCHFCGASDSLFAESEDALDLHMWRDCPMLGHCPHCKQVIEIANLNDHLLVECEFRNNHRACPRCGEAIAAQLFEKHVKRSSCLIAKPKTQANRCPLCHNDIPPFDSGWKRHLMEVKCPNNVRTMEFEDEDEDEGLLDGEDDHI